jgi:putative Holliday junction resolvase
MKIMGLDVGEKRIGIALSDSTHTIAQSLECLKRKSLDEDIQALEFIIKENEVGIIVAGLPLNMDGTSGKQAKTVIDFVHIVKERTGLKVETYDERLTSKLAESVLIESDMSRKKRKGKIDSLAAVLILQGYLDSIKN